MSSGIKFCTTASFASASQLKGKVCEVFVRLCTYFLVPVLHAGYLRYYTALNQFVQFVEDWVRLLECSPASCLAPWKHFEEKCEKFITRRVNNKSPSHFSLTQLCSVEFEKPARMENQYRENVFVRKKHYFKSSSRNCESILMKDLSIPF